MSTPPVADGAPAAPPTADRSARLRVVDEASARRVLMLQAFETGDEASPHWTPEDRSWATRAAHDSAGRDAVRFIAARAEHAMQRLLPRDASLAGWLKPAAQRRRMGLRAGAWLVAAVVLAFVLGALVERIGPLQRVDLFAIPLWMLVLWNVAVGASAIVAVLLKGPAKARTRSRLRRWLVAAAEPVTARSAPVQRFASSWSAFAWPRNGARAALTLHLAAAAFAAGIVAGMYLRGLVLDYRVGWQSTFIEADAVRATLALLLAPASALTGIAVPDTAAIAAMRVTPDSAAQAPAAPWLHLFAATLLLFVIVPRLLLAWVASWFARRRTQRWRLPLDEPYFRRLAQQAQHGPTTVGVVPHAAAPAAASMLSLQALLAASGTAVTLRVADPVRYGDEEAAATAIAADSTVALAVFDFAATPEPDVHGRLLRALAARRPAVTLGAVADETAFVRRFGATAPRRAERRAAWQQLARTEGVPIVCIELEQPSPDDGAALRRNVDG